jgi:hypothetical protein
MNKINKIIFYSFSSFVILLGLLVLIIKNNEDKIIARAVKGINEYLTTEVYIQQVSFTVVKNFPEISIRFDHVHGLPHQEKKSKADTLFYFDKAWVNFNLVQLLRRDYTIRDIECKNGKFYMKVAPDGSKNYIFWKRRMNKPGKKTSTALQIEKIRLKDVVVNYENNEQEIYTSTNFLNSTWNVDVLQDNFHLQHEGNLDVKYFTKNKVNYISNSQLYAQLDLEKEAGVLKIRNGKLKYLNLFFEINGTYNLKKNNNLDLIIEGKDLNMNQVISSIPSKLIPEISNYKGKGSIDFNLYLSGETRENKHPHVELAFDIRDGSISKRYTRNKINNLNLSGHFSNGNKNLPVSSAIILKKCDFTLGSGRIKCNGLIRNLNNPYFEGELHANADLEEIFSFVDYPSLQKIKGAFSTSLQLSGRLPGDKITWRSLKTIKPEGYLTLSDVSFKLAGKPWNYESLVGRIEFKEGLYFQKLSVVINQNDFLLEGKIDNGWESLFDSTAVISGHTDVFSRELNLDNFYFIKKDGDSTPSTEKNKLKIQFPNYLDLQVDFNVEKFSFQRFQANKVSGKIHYRPGVFNLKNMSFYTLSGKIDGGGIIAQNYHRDFEVKCYAVLTSIDISKMFYAFKNFGQSYLTSTHLNGEINGKVNLSATWGNNLKVNKKSIVANADVVVNNGELMNFIPMLSLSKYIEVDELKHIYFNTLENNFFIKDEVITMPQMDIYSSAFNIKASGTHDFNNNIDYRLQLFLSEILARESNIKENSESEFGIVEDDGLGKTKLYFKILGNVKDFDVSYDRARAIRSIKTNLKNEKDELKNIFREEFGRNSQPGNENVNDPDRVKAMEDPAMEREENGNEKRTGGFKIQWDDDAEINSDTLNKYSF